MEYFAQILTAWITGAPSRMAIFKKENVFNRRKSSKGIFLTIAGPGSGLSFTTIQE